MSLESTLERIADALEGILANVKTGSKPAAAANTNGSEEPAKSRSSRTKPAAPKVNIEEQKEELRASLQKLLDMEPKKESLDKAKEILLRFGVKKLGDLAADQFEECKRIVEGVIDGTLEPNGEPASENLL